MLGQVKKGTQLSWQPGLQLQDFLLETDCDQQVEEVTRRELVNGVIETGEINHIYSNCTDKLKGPYVEYTGDRDHQRTKILKAADCT